MPQDKRYGLPFIIAVLLHLLIIIFFVVQLGFSSQYTTRLGNDTRIVNAVMVNQHDVDQAVSKIKAAQQQQDVAKAQQLKEEREQLALLKKNRAEEQAHLKQVKKDQEQVKAQQMLMQKTEQAKLQQIQAEQRQYQKQLSLLQDAAEKAKKQQAAAKSAAKEAVVKAKQAAQQKQQAALDKKKLEKKKKVAALAQKKQDADDLLQQQLQTEQNQLSSARSRYMQGIIDKYKALIVSAIERQWNIPADVSKDLSCELSIHLAPGGTVLNVAVSRSSGVDALDRSAVAAVYKASPLPVPDSPDAFEGFKELALTVKPENVIDSTN